MISEFLEGLVWWHWLVFAMALLVVEITAPVMWFLWVALAAGLVALITFIGPGLAWPVQLILFGALAVASLFLGRRFFRGERGPHDAPALNRRGERHVGRVYTLVEPIENGRGAARVGDTRWQVSGEDQPVGARVRVTQVDGTLLHVVPDESVDT